MVQSAPGSLLSDTAAPFTISRVSVASNCPHPLPLPHSSETASRSLSFSSGRGQKLLMLFNPEIYFYLKNPTEFLNPGVLWKSLEMSPRIFCLWNLILSLLSTFCPWGISSCSNRSSVDTCRLWPKSCRELWKDPMLHRIHEWMVALASPGSLLALKTQDFLH